MKDLMEELDRVRNLLAERDKEIAHLKVSNNAFS